MFHVIMVYMDDLVTVILGIYYILQLFLETINKLRDGSIRAIIEDAPTRCPLTDIDSHIPTASNLALLWLMWLIMPVPLESEASHVSCQ